MFALKRCGQFCKDQSSMTMSIAFQPTSPNKNEGTPEIFIPNLVAKLSNSGPSNHSLGLAVSQTPRYSEYNFQQIFKIVLETRLFLPHSQDWGIFEDPPEQAFEPRALDVYNSKFHIDCYHFI